VILSSGKDLEDIRGGERYIRSLANITDIEFITDKSRVPEEVMSAVIGNVEIYIPLDDLLDYKAEYDRLQKEKTRLSGEVERVRGKLANEGFVSKAPEKVINEEREKLAKYEDMLVKISERLALVEKKLPRVELI
jgi:valyl-tRNA synthetase